MPARELSFLNPAMDAISSADDCQRIDIVEAASSIIGGWRLDDYRDAIERDRSMTLAQSQEWGGRLLSELRHIPWAIPLALSTVAQRELTDQVRRRSGVYFTDHRLARHLAQILVSEYSNDQPVIDPAAGNGILLAAFVTKLGEKDKQHAFDFVQKRLSAADLSEHSLFITRAVVAACLSSKRTPWAIEGFSERILVGDSLARSQQEWRAIAPNGFGGVIGNPPWEKLKTTIHEAWHHGVRQHHYGASEARNVNVLHRAYLAHAEDLKQYARGLRKNNRTNAKGELDLYILFTELSIHLLGPEGVLCYLVPAGLIRSIGTKRVRDYLFSMLDDVEIVIHDNRPGYFEIDSRFKFLTISGVRRLKPGHRVSLSHTKAAIGLTDVAPTPTVEIEVGTLKSLQPDLTLPEVRSAAEWSLFCKLHDKAHAIFDTWAFSYARELDMTNDKHLFLEPSNRGVPLVEGRMVHQYRWHAKAYLAGSGRSAHWEPTDLRERDVRPQFRVCPDRLPPKALQRYQTVRAGFCDITGQTNERSVLASIIPAGVVCGNKVPTLRLSVTGLTEEDAAYLWVGIANSFVYDWLARRIITTTLNQFLLQAIPLPSLGPWVENVVQWSRQVQLSEGSPQISLLQIQNLRARIDHAVACAYDVSAEDFRLIFEDFPQIDRMQNDAVVSPESTVTRDSILALFGDHGAAERLSIWAAAGKIGFVPNQFSGVYNRIGRGDLNANAI